MHQKDDGRLLPLGDTSTDGAEDKTFAKRELDLPPTGNTNSRGILGGGGDICCPLKENRRTVHHKQTHNGYMSGIITSTWEWVA